jgi:hypothetical protein
VLSFFVFQSNSSLKDRKSYESLWLFLSHIAPEDATMIADFRSDNFRILIQYPNSLPWLRQNSHLSANLRSPYSKYSFCFSM